jgi:peptidoglycan-associated lipoprotein
MRNFTRGLSLVIILSLVLLASGCGKKKVEQVGEVTPPQQRELGTKAPGDMGMQMPGSEGGVQSTPQAGALAGAAAAFEDRDIYFDYDRFNVRPEDRKILAEKASYLNANPSVRVRIEGHCDERGTSEYNLALGERRAKAALDYLVFLGISRDRLTTISYGEEKPLDPAQNEQAWAKNRRAHFDILGD